MGWNDYGARNYDALLGRWMGVDALAEKYMGYSGYNYCLNSPMLLIDPDGKDNIIYILALPGTNRKVMQGVEKEMASLLTAGGINAKVQMVYDTKNFNINLMDKTDAVAVVGTKQSASNYIKKNFSGWVSEDYTNNGADGSLTSWQKTKDNPEISDGYGKGSWGYVTAIDITENENSSFSQYQTPNMYNLPEQFGMKNKVSRYLSMNIIHGIGHISGLKHYDKYFMGDGGNLKDDLGCQSCNYSNGNLEQLVKNGVTNSSNIKDKFNNRFKVGVEPKLNYEPK